MRVYTAPKIVLERILDRKKREDFGFKLVDLESLLRDILKQANRFIPSESSSILLDDPTLDWKREKPGLLYFAACFGKKSKKLCGTALPAGVGIAGKTYATGKPIISADVKNDANFYPSTDEKTGYRTRSIICAPIKIKGATVGVIELINKLGGSDYTSDDLKLLGIFADYTSTHIQITLDARRFGDLSLKDNLTGLYNDRFLFERLTREVSSALRHGKDLSAVFIDIDKFKVVNDTWGHLAGSRVLAEVGSILTFSTNSLSSLQSRYGGDEFILVFPNTSIEAAAGHAEKIRETIEKFVFLKNRYPEGGKALKIKGLVTASIGVSSLRASVSHRGTVKQIRDALIKQSDHAMYMAKEQGGNRVCIAQKKADPTKHRRK